MSKREQLKLVKKKTKKEKITRNLYATSSIILNTINIIHNPYLLNGLILEINIAIIIYCIYSWIKSQKTISNLKEEELDIRIRTILTSLE